MKKPAFVVTLIMMLFAASTSYSAGPKTYTNSIGMEFVLVPFAETSTNDFGETRIVRETPLYFGKYEVTQEQWVAIMGPGSNPSEFKGRTHPVESVSWKEVQEFIKRLNAKEGHKRYRLPTEEEWTFAARGGTDTEYFFTREKLAANKSNYAEIASKLAAYAWFGNGEGLNKNGQIVFYTGNAEKTTHPVGQKKPNPYGLYDIYGNVWEYMQEQELQKPISRGGGWASGAADCRSRSRHVHMDYRVVSATYIGFRLVLEPGPN